MNDFAALIDRVLFEQRRNGKLRILADYFRDTPDPERGWALAAMTDALSFANAKPGLIRQLVEERVDPLLFRLSYDYVGDLSETAALVWPAPNRARGYRAQGQEPVDPPSLTDVIETLSTAKKSTLPDILVRWLDGLDEIGRYALLKLITGNLRIGVSARLAKTSLAVMANGLIEGATIADETAEDGRRPLDVSDVEEVWHGLEPPYTELFAWLEGRGDPPASRNPAPFRSPMLSHPVEDGSEEARSVLPKLDPADFSAEWKWDGIRVQAVAGRDETGAAVRRLYSRTGDDISGAFPDVVEAMDFEAAIDGELLVRIDGRVQPFAALQKRLGRKKPGAKTLAEGPAHIRAYDILAEGEEDLRGLTLEERRARLEAVIGDGRERFDLSPIIGFKTWDDIASARETPADWGAGEDAEAVEGVMLKRRDSPYVAGRPKGPWWKWKRDPYSVDAVMMYAQRGHGRRSSYYSDFTFGVWRAGPEGEELVPVGKAYSGYTDKELLQIDRFVRKNTVSRFGPVREVTHTKEAGLVLEIGFEGLNRSTRHKSGLAMRFPRILRLRWDKPTAEADRIEALEALLPAES
ncbi:MAG: cisplatin damage response ATP-dependent DNA ligase [Pseudomonadota bacterium]